MEDDNGVNQHESNIRESLVQLNNVQLVMNSYNFITSYLILKNKVPNRNKYKLLSSCSLFFSFYLS